jgi:L,D-transpeptidase-like protein
MRRAVALIVGLGSLAAVAGSWRTGAVAPPPMVATAQPPAAATAVADAERTWLFSIARETWVYDKPDTHGVRLGYLRAGGRVRAARAASTEGCRDGWYAVEPRGFVCAGAEATVDSHHPVVELSSRPPRRDELPYLYLHSRYPPPPFYGRLPSLAEQREREPDLVKSRAKRERAIAENDLPPADPLPPLLAGGGTLPGLGGGDRGAGHLGRAHRRSGFALLATYDHDGRRFGLVSELALVPLDRGRVVEPSPLRGAELGPALRLPIAIVKSPRAHRYDGDGHRGESIGRYAVIALADDEVERAGRRYYATRDGDFVRADQVGRVERFRKAPVWAERGDKWIDVSILRQTLVAYEGTEPVFATLVSTGQDGIARASKSRATIQGTFLVHSKHLTITMNGDEQGEEFDLRDVPFVQYFSEGYALHAAYWHDDFGRPRSHGCVNLAPHDAAWLFGWTGPEVPDGWHAALSTTGTLVHIHP